MSHLTFRLKYSVIYFTNSCFQLPDYSSESVLRERLLAATAEKGFHLNWESVPLQRKGLRVFPFQQIQSKTNSWCFHRSWSHYLLLVLQCFSMSLSSECCCSTADESLRLKFNRKFPFHLGLLFLRRSTLDIHICKASSYSPVKLNDNSPALQFCKRCCLQFSLL